MTEMATYMKNRREDRRIKLIELKGGVCEDCGSTESLEFNHIDRFNKSFTLSGAGLDTAWTKILEEVEKCELLCKEHHLERTREQYRSKQIVAHNSNRHLPYLHGTMRSYQEINCRCNLCKAAKKAYRNKETTYSEIVIPQ